MAVMKAIATRAWVIEMKTLKMICLFLAFLILTFGLAACDEEDSYQFCPHEDDLSLKATCDIAQPACQKKVFKATLCVNGSAMPIPPVRIISKAQWLAEMGYEDVATDSKSAEAETDTDTDTHSDSAGDTDSMNDTESTGDTDTASETVSNWEEMLRLVGLLESESVEEAMKESYVDGVAAFYSYDYQDVTIIRNDETISLEESMLTLAHEFTHAVQDYEVGSNEQHELYSYDDDILMALDNVHEGDANVRADFAYAVLMGLDVDELYTREYYSRRLAYLKRAIAAEPSSYPLVKKWLTYRTGALYIYDTWVSEGMAGMNRLRSTFPTSTVYFMAGYNETMRDATEMPPHHFNQSLKCAEAGEPAGYDHQHQDSMGAAMLYAVLSAYRKNGVYDVAVNWDFALHWRGDALHIFRETNGSNVAVAWHFRMDSAASATQLKAKLQEKLPHGYPLQFESELIEFLSTDPSIVPNWISAYTCEAHRPE